MIATLPLLPRTTFGAIIEPIIVDQYHEMISVGILREGAPVELIDGVIVRKDRGDRGAECMAGPRHASAVGQLDFLLRVVESHGFFCRNQAAATLAAKQEPEPDIAVVRGERKDFFHRHPRPDEIAIAIEVSDTSLSCDRTTKQRIYANAGIPIYWIANLVDNMLEVYSQALENEGLYGRKSTYRPGEIVELELSTEQLLQISIAEIFPPSAEQT